MRLESSLPWRRGLLTALLPAVLILLAAPVARARDPIRQAFFQVYTNAVGTVLDTLPSNATHCGVCHFDFNGGGARNPYGIAVAAYTGGLSKATYSNAVVAAGLLDSDGDGFLSRNEITNRLYANTPTFPGLSVANVGSVVNIPAAQVTPYLTPSSGVDTNPPMVVVTFPNGGELLTANRVTNITWTASDAGGIASIRIHLSLDNGVTFTPVALGLSNSGAFAWTPANRPTTIARIRVIAMDLSGNTSNDVSNAAFVIQSPPGGRVPTTLRDFDQPGTQPFEGGAALAPPQDCATCHGGYDPAVEPYTSWGGSMMAHSSIDPLFEANMAIANQDAPDSGDLCLRCHLPRGWLDGRSVPTDGSGMMSADKAGVSCALCHQMVDPVYQAGTSPTVDTNILAALSFRGTNYGNGMYVMDPSGTRRGPFTNHVAPHSVVVSPFHRSAAFCGTCHDVSNPAFVKDANGVYQPNTLNQTSSTFSAHSLAPVERTYSEWLHSAYNTTGGVYAPQFAGNKPDGRVRTCQDCHMRDVNAMGANPSQSTGVFSRADMPLHDMTGGSTWLPLLLTNLYPAQVDASAITAGVARAKAMLQAAATLGSRWSGRVLSVTVTNETGHKLPTGYPEGRRIWINVRFYDAQTNLVGESCAYDPETGVLTHDAEATIYEVHPGIDTNVSQITGLPVGPSFHFVLNNRVFHDNRIPPRGFSNAAYAAFGGAPVGHAYADGQYWDTASYTAPVAAVRAEIRLYYQSTSKEFVEFLRDENTTNTKGQEMYDLWNNNGKCPPTLMASTLAMAPPPSVLSLAPQCGPVSGGTPLLIAGTNFSAGASATLGGALIADAVVVNGTTITGTAPAGVAGPADVAVSVPGRGTSTLAGAWTYVQPPLFAGVTGSVPGIESALILWPSATSAQAVAYGVYMATSAGAQDYASPVLVTSGLSCVLSPLDPGSTNAVTYFVVVRASSGCGGAESNTVELAVQPLLDPAKDQDGDGLPNAFEVAYALLPFNPSDALIDGDGDGFSNLEEFIAWTDPTVAASHFEIMALGAHALMFSSSVDRLYLLEVGDLLSGSWIASGNEQGGNDGMMQMPLTNDGPTLIYRLRVRKP